MSEERKYLAAPLSAIRDGAAGRALVAAWWAVAPFAGLLVVVLVFSAYQPEGDPNPFVVGFRLTRIATQSAIVGMGALGMTLVIISGGIDLSAGSMLALTSVVMALALKDEWNPVLAVAVVVAAGIAAGTLNGVLITGLRLVPFIVTLGTMLFFRGMAEWLAGSTKIQAPTPPAWIADLLMPPPEGSLQFVCTGVWIVLALAAVVAATLRYTVFGRYVFALGSNEATARLCGINVPKVKICVYALGGFFMGIAGIFAFSRLSAQGDPRSGLGLELDLIAAVVIGGGSLSGGRGSVLGSIVGALTMTTLRSGCDYYELSTPVQNMIIGAIIIAAVAIDQLVHRGKGP